MGNNNAGLLVLLFLILALALVVPLLFLYSYHGSAALPALTYSNIAIAATVGLFIIPALFIYLAAIILAAKTRRAGPALARYPWEGVFPEVVKGAELPLPRARVAAKKAATKAKAIPQESAVNIRVVLALAVVIIVLVALTFWSQRMSGIFGYQSNLAKANVSMAKNVSHTPSEAGKITNATMLANITKLPAENKSAVKAVKSIAIMKNATPATGKTFGIKNFKNFVTAAKNSGVKTAGKNIGWFRDLTGKVGNYIHKMPIVVWRSITAAVLVIILIAALSYSHKTGQLSEAGAWLKDIAGWLGAIPAVIRRDNFAKIIMPAILIIVAVALVAGYVFRKWLGANLPGFAFMANNLVTLPSMARDFILVYRLYILIGVFTLLAVIGFLMTVERRGNGKKADGEKQPKNSAPVVSKKKNGRK